MIKHKVIKVRCIGRVYAIDIVWPKRSKVVQNLVIICEVKPESTEFQVF
jgi:hypothetical protein